MFSCENQRQTAPNIQKNQRNHFLHRIDHMYMTKNDATKLNRLRIDMMSSGVNYAKLAHILRERKCDAIISFLEDKICE